MESRLLDAAERAAALAGLPGWRIVDGRLHRSLRFPDFAAAFAFMTRVAAVAEGLNHHPDWSNSYGRVEIALVTHDLGALGTLDVALAREIDRLLKDHPAEG